jgi:hypothetical protein
MAATRVLLTMKSKARKASESVNASHTIGVLLATEHGDVEDEARGPRFLFDHRTITMQSWHDLLDAHLLVTIFTIPLNIAFLSDRENPHFITRVDMYIDVLFWVDIALTFFTTYEDDDGNVIRDLSDIVKRYTLGRSASTFFAIDFVSAFPWEECSGAVGIDLKYARCIRVLRLGRVVRRYRELALNTKISFFVLSVSKLAFIVMAAIHWAAAAFIVFAQESGFSDDTWAGHAVPDLQYLSVWEQYYICIYWSVTAFTTVGYGDLSPVVNDHPSERAFAAFFMSLSLANMVLSSYFIASVTLFMTKGDEETSEFRAEAEFVTEFVTKRKLPKALGTTILQYLHHQYKMRGTATLLDSFPAAVKTQVREALHAHVVKEVALFRGTSGIFIKTIVSQCEEEQFMDGMTVLSELDLVNECYILMSGEAEVLMRVPDDVGGGVEVAGRLGPGAVLGGHGLLCGQLQPWTIRIVSDAHALKITRAEIDDLASKLPTDFSRLLNNLNNANAQLMRKVAREQKGDASPPKPGESAKKSDGKVGPEELVAVNLAEPSSGLDYPPRHAAAVEKWFNVMREFSPKIQAAVDLHNLTLAGRLCLYAQKENRAELEQALQSGIPPDVCDYDSRTGMVSLGRTRFLAHNPPGFSLIIISIIIVIIIMCVSHLTRSTSPPPKATSTLCASSSTLAQTSASRTDGGRLRSSRASKTRRLRWLAFCSPRGPTSTATTTLVSRR